MSYILDALKRADAERERERSHVPSLYTRNLPPGTRNPRQRAERPSRPRWWLLVAAAMVVIALALLLLWWWRTGSGAVPVAPTPAPEAMTPAAATPPPADPQSPGPASPAVAEGPMLPILAPEPPKPPPRRPATPSKVAVTKSNSQGSAQVEPPASTAAASATATTAQAPTSSIPHFGELSAEARARLPSLSINGATYSKNPALRMLIVNGKVMQEGQEVAPGLKLEVIEPRSAVMNHQGMRYRVGY